MPVLHIPQTVPLARPYDIRESAYIPQNSRIVAVDALQFPGKLLKLVYRIHKREVYL